MKHRYARQDQMRVKFLHRQESGKFHWGPSAKYGFHCFNDFGGNGECEDFEWRSFKDCI